MPPRKFAYENIRTIAAMNRPTSGKPVWASLDHEMVGLLRAVRGIDGVLNSEANLLLSSV